MGHSLASCPYATLADRHVEFSSPEYNGAKGHVCRLIHPVALDHLRAFKAGVTDGSMI